MDKEQVLDYIMTTPHNPNRAVLSDMLDGLGGDIDLKEGIWFTGTIDESVECLESNAREVAVSPTSLVDFEIFKDIHRKYYTNFSIKLNDIELTEYIVQLGWSIQIVEGEKQFREQMTIQNIDSSLSAGFACVFDNVENIIETVAYVPCDWTGEVNVYISKKS